LARYSANFGGNSYRKLDGENNCLNRHGVFARSHATPTESPWTSQIRQQWQLIKNDLGDLEIFGENLYAIHSIEYQDINAHYYVFGIRENERWLPWEETKFYTKLLDLQTVPEIKSVKNLGSQSDFEKEIMGIVSQSSAFGSIDILTQKPCTMEGIVSRNSEEYLVEDFAKNVFKYVRKGHVKTDEHWTRNWKYAKNKGKFLYPVKAMAKVFRAKFVAELRKQLVLDQRLYNGLFLKDWRFVATIVYAKRPFGNPKAVIEYLGRYTMGTPSQGCYQ
jgi:RNA ligase/Putative transposase